ncbi:hypothetical protein PENARI_c034G01182 [Penicillium arizonense]|uniref:Uncharacterized protein n=1 Tax=Penicillium arizonense TaxID=1835702 RepID=A0A1F5L4I1_PENAI|nr:hypothetical protein PENARI_c034G01182 [Penicillium arizonense]
MWHHRYLSFGG